MAEKTISVKLRADIGQYKAAMSAAASTTKKFGNDLLDTAGKNEQAFRTLGTGALAFGATLAGGLALAARASMNFQQEMSNVAAVSGATAGELARLSDAAIQAGADTAFSASQAAQAQAELVRAGISTADVLGGALTGSLDLAAAGQLDLAKAAEISAQAMNIFGLAGSDVSHIADVLASGANKSAADVTQLGEALRQGGLVAAQTGLSLEETVGALSAFADRGLIASDAGTSLKTALQRLTPQSAEAQTLMDELGFSAYDAAGNFIGLAGFADELQTSLGGMSVEQRNAALSTLFGSDAVRGAGVLYELGAEGVREYTAAVDDQGAAARTAAIQLDNLAGDFEAFSGSVETALIGVGGQMDGFLRSTVQIATGAVNAFGELPDSAQQAGVAVAGVGAAAGIAGGGMLLLLPKINDARKALSDLNVTGGNVVKFMTGPWGAAIAGASLLVYSFVKAQAEAAAQISGVTEALKAEREGVENATEAFYQEELSRRGLLEVTERLGLTQADVLAAINNEAGAREELNKVLNEQWTLGQTVQDFFATATTVGSLESDVTRLRGFVEGAGQAAEVASTRLDLLRGAMVATLGPTDAAGGALERMAANSLNVATNAAGAASGVAGYADAAAGALDPVVELDERQQALQDTLLGFHNTLGAYTDALAVKEEKERESAQATADATEDAADSWEDFGTDVTLTLAEYFAALAEQVGAQRDWQTNMLLLAGRVSQGTLDELARMGPEGAPLVAQLVDASGAELANLEHLFGESTAAATDAVRQQLEDARPILAAISAAGGREIADELARGLASGTTTVGTIMHDYQRTIANGVNPILIAMGRSGVRIAGITGPGGFVEASGGVVDYYAAGGVRENHVAQIAPAGAYRVWAEPETGGEAYIPLLAHRSPRRPAEKVAPGLFVADVAPKGAEDSGPGAAAGVEVEAARVLVAA